MQHIYFAEAIKAINFFAQEYNQQFYQDGHFDLKQCVRSPHIRLIQHLVKLYAARLHQLNKLKFAQLTIHTLRTNNVALAAQLMLSERTIQRQMERLLTAGILTDKKFRGTNADYEISFNPKILGLFVQPTDEGKKAVCEAREALQLTNCRHIDTEKINNRLMGNVEFVENPIQSPPTSTNDFVSTGNNVTGNTTEKAKNSVETKKNVAEARENFQEKMSKDEFENTWKLVENLWIFCFSLLYSKLKFMTASEVYSAKEYFFNTLKQTKPESRETKFKELIQRIRIVQRWKDKDPDRYIPIPSVYFNDQNEKGFKRTELWYHQHKINIKQMAETMDLYKEEIRLQQHFSKAVREYQKNPGLTSFMQTSTKLGKISPHLQNEFYSIIVNQEKQQLRN
jgi:DNA-binding Lrp family transcriptional regulator